MHIFSFTSLKCIESPNFWSNGLLVKVLDSQSREGFPCSKPLHGTKVNSAYHPSKVDEMSTSNFLKLSGKKKMPPHSGSLVLRQLNPIHNKVAIKLKVNWTIYVKRIVPLCRTVGPSLAASWALGSLSKCSHLTAFL